ncbi:MAG TPA: hypothetical protein PLJ27_25940 [Polyangiaceae bacterium]|nr:MAG: hypothetical protein BWY17_01308 [Deltaproteobacteria bacterium ADurb.Bin207]HNS96667.1 hypothetical protein [Polyangiaceae bacterium]HNZ23059.1 hypothetical protein [Polyangiaceae bacterium]HOD21164.1 hypothetical protein [Polyangiaceae bacterium]HOE48932.1 hypothetical protein [Polyangiaceae bacterium]
MPDPIGVCQTRDRRLCYEPQPSPDEVKKQQSATAGALRRGKEVATFLATEAAMEAGAIHAERMLAASSNALLRKGATALPVVAAGIAAVKGTVLLQRIIDISKEEGKELNQAYAAQSRDVAILMIVAQTDPTSMPAGYLPHRAQEIGANKYQHPAFKLATEVMSSKSVQSSELRTAVVNSFQQGSAAVYCRQISNSQALEQALKNDSDFKKRYDSDPAFHQGVLAAIDQAIRDPAAHAAHVHIAQSRQAASLQTR